MAPAIHVGGPEMAPHTPRRSASPGEPGARLDNRTAAYRGRSAIPCGALPTGIARTWVWVATSMTETWSA